MNSTQKTFALLLALAIPVGLVTAARAPVPPGFCNNLIDCVEHSQSVQDALENATHDRYTDAEAVAAMDLVDDENTLNHNRYTDQEARDAVGPVGLSGYEISMEPYFDIKSGFGQTHSLRAFCPIGKIPVGGGGRMINGTQNGGRVVVASFPFNNGDGPEDRGWTVTWADNNFDVGFIDAEIFVICVDE